MKKQLLIAAVAATMTSAAIADISITGSAKANYLNTDSKVIANNSNTFSSEINLGIKGTNGGSGVVVNLQSKNQADQADGTATSRGFDIQDSYVTSSIADVAVQMGSWRGAHNLLEDGDTTTANRFKATTTIAGVTVTYEDGSSTAAKGESIKLAGEVSGISVSHKMYNNGSGVDETDTSVSGSLGGVNVAYRTIDSDTNASDKDSLEVSYEMNGVTLTYAEFGSDSANTSNITSDGSLGDINAVDAQGFMVSTAMAGNTIKLRTVDTKVGAHTNGENTINSIIVTRPLASGATFEATYTDTDLTGTGEDKTTLDLELAVKF